MKLSDVRGERTLEVIAEIIGPLANIAQHPDMKRLYANGDRPAEISDTQWFMRKVTKVVPSIIRDNKSDVIDILCAIEGTERDAYVASLTMPKLFSDVYEVFTDKELLAFLSQSETTEEKPLGVV